MYLCMYTKFVSYIVKLNVCALNTNNMVQLL